VLLSDHSPFHRHTLVAFALFFVVSLPLFCQTVPVKTSICEAFAHPERFEGKLVEIKATYSATFEGAWISDSACRDYLGEIVDSEQHGMAKEYADVVRDMKRKFALKGMAQNEAWQEFNYASSRLFTGMGPTQPDGTTVKYHSITADFVGVMVIRRNFKVRNGFGNGWGHLGASRFLLILTSVANVTPHPL